jgi:hypothetical protein
MPELLEGTGRHNLAWAKAIRDQDGREQVDRLIGAPFRQIA